MPSPWPPRPSLQAMLARSLNIFQRLKDEGSGYREGWTLLEKELVLEMEYTNWAVLSDRTISALAAYLLDLLVFVEKTFVADGEGGTEALTEGEAEGGAAAATQGDGTGPGRPSVPDKCRDGAPPEALDCAFAILDVVEKMMEARFLKCMGDELERPFDPVGSLHLYQTLVTALRLLVAVMQFEGYEPAPPVEKEKAKAKEGEEKRKGNRRPPPVPGSHGLALSRSESLSSSSLVLHGTHPSLSSPRNALAPKTFTFDDAAGESQVHTKSKANEPLQYLVTVLYLLSHTSVQTDVTAFWEAPDAIVEEQWSSRNFQALLACIGIVLGTVCPPLGFASPFLSYSHVLPIVSLVVPPDHGPERLFPCPACARQARTVSLTEPPSSSYFFSPRSYHLSH